MQNVATGKRVVALVLFVFMVVVFAAGLHKGVAFAEEQPASASAALSASSESATAEQAQSAGSESATAEEEDPIVVGVVAMPTDREKPTCTYIEKCGAKSKLIQSVNFDIDEYDALLVPGGGNDVSPSLYGAKRIPETEVCRIVRDVLFIKVVKRFADAGKPVLGLCGGEQIINVAFGGTLIQDLDGYHEDWHPVKVSEKSHFYSVCGSEANVYHYHHQCVDKLGEGLVATQWDLEEGYIEAIEHETLPIYGLQWHPEASKEVGIKVGQEFLKVCRDYRDNARAQAA